MNTENQRVMSGVARIAGAVAILFFLVNVYLDVPLVLSGFYIPSFYIILSLAPLWFVSRQMILRQDIALFAAMTTLFFVTALCAPNLEDLSSRVWSAIQGSVAVLGLCICIAFTTNMKRPSFEWLFLVVLATILTLAFAEVIGLTDSLSDAFRFRVYTMGYGVYDADARDIALSGQIRPKVFTSEPSLVGIGLYVFGVAYLWVRPTLSKAAALAAGAIVAYRLIGSPIPLLLVLSSGLAFLYIRSNGRGMNGIVYVVAAIAASLTFYNILPDDVSERFSLSELFNTQVSKKIEEESSEKLRIVYPYISAYESIIFNPITGVGMGGKRSLSKFSSVSDEPAIAFGNNAFATYIMYFGLLGVVIFWGLLVWYLKRRMAALGLTLFHVVALMQTMGSAEGPRIWSYMAILVATFVQFNNWNSLRYESPTTVRAK